MAQRPPCGPTASSVSSGSMRLQAQALSLGRAMKTRRLVFNPRTAQNGMKARRRSGRFMLRQKRFVISPTIPATSSAIFFSDPGTAILSSIPIFSKFVRGVRLEEEAACSISA